MLFWFTHWVDASVVGRAVEAGAFTVLATGDNVDEEFVSITKSNVAVEVGNGIDVAPAQCTSKIMTKMLMTSIRKS